MNKYNLLFCDNNAAKLTSAMTFFADDNDFSAMFCNSNSLVNDFLRLKIDVLVIDTDFPGSETILRSLGEARPKVVLTSSLTHENLVKRYGTDTYDYCFVKPFSFTELRAKLLSLLTTSHTIKINNKSVDERLSGIFIRAGIPPHIKGYQFLREAVKLAINNPDMINSITKKLYPAVATNFNTSSSKVERAIRHAIEVAWNRGKIENINAIFGIKIYSKNDKPTNGELIALVADKIMIENM